MTAQEALKGALRDRLGPVLRAAGFKGSAPTWTLTAPNGDRAVVNVQTSDSSSKQEALFTVNLETLEDARLRSIFWPMAQWCRQAIRVSFYLPSSIGLAKPQPITVTVTS